MPIHQNNSGHSNQVVHGRCQRQSAWWRLLLAFAVLAGLVGCATQGGTHSPDERDPWEGFNRGAFKFNSMLDQAVLRPVAKGYDKVTPDFVQSRFSNFVHNTFYPHTVVNLALRGKLGAAAVGVGRVVVNLTVGLLGLFDPASKMGIPLRDEDFGQTLAAWGWKDSRYLVLPFLGPGTLRDVIGINGVDFYYYHPFVTMSDNADTILPVVFEVVHSRAGLLDSDAALYEAYDPYVFMRDAYLQNREYLIYDGDPPQPDYEDFLDQEPSEAGQ